MYDVFLGGTWAAKGRSRLVGRLPSLDGHAACCKSHQLPSASETFGDPSLVDSFRFETHLQKEALLYDNANLGMK